ncbi:MAG: GNAT family N-acetyltransferase [Candidatus Dormibacteria bacterium]
MLTIEAEPFISGDAARLVDACYRELRARSGPGGAPAPVAADFDEPTGVFLIAREDGRAVACGGLRRLVGDIAEIRRMFTLAEFRGRGIARQLLHNLEGHGLRLGYRTVRLETGWLMREALAVYKGAGYLVIPCYGEFNDRESVCMEKVLTA